MLSNLQFTEILFLIALILLVLPFVISYLITILQWFLYFLGAFTAVIVYAIMYILKKWRNFK